MEKEQSFPIRNRIVSVVPLGKGSRENVFCPAVANVMQNGSETLYMFGGCTGERTTGNLMKCVLSDNFNFEQLSPLGSVPSDRACHSLTAKNNKLYLFGGAKLYDSTDNTADILSLAGSDTGPIHSAEIILSDLWEFNCDTNTWLKLSSDGPPRASHSSYFRDESTLVIIGGATRDPDLRAPPISEINVFDLTSNQWSIEQISVPQCLMNFGCVGGAISVYENVCHLFGGLHFDIDSSLENPMTLTFLNNHIFKILNKEILILEPSANNLAKPLSRAFHTMQNVNGKFMIYGGQTAFGAKIYWSSDIYIWDIKEKIWHKPMIPGQLQYFSHASALYGSSALIIGGCINRDDKLVLCNQLCCVNISGIRSSGKTTDKFKVVVLGDSGVGKSCIITRFVHDLYTQNHLSTIGVDFKKMHVLTKGKLLTLELWDTAGQERFSVMTTSYYRGAHAFFFIFDVTSRDSYNHALNRWTDLAQKNHDFGSDTVKILIGNMSDLDAVISHEEACSAAEARGMIYVSCSARTGLGIDHIFLTAADLVMSQEREVIDSSVTTKSAKTNAPFSVSLTEPTKRKSCNCV